MVSILNHSVSAYGGGYYPTTLFRIAVPFFFVFSSFLFFNREGASIKKYVKRLLLLDVAWTIVQSPVIVYNFFLTSGDTFALSLIKFLQAALVGESYMGSWFIHASWLGMLIVYYLVRLDKPIQWIVGLICFALALIDTSYSSLLFDSGFDISCAIMSKVVLPSESFIVAIPYMLIGGWLAKVACKNTLLQHPCVLAFSVMILFVEAYFCRHVISSDALISELNNPRFEQFIMLPIVVVCIISVLTKMNLQISDTQSLYVRNLSILVYLSHQVLMMFVYKLGFAPIGIGFFVTSSIISVLFGVAIIYLSSKIKVLRYLY